jgi:hypothetical protein
MAEMVTPPAIRLESDMPTLYTVVRIGGCADRVSLEGGQATGPRRGPHCEASNLPRLVTEAISA